MGQGWFETVAEAQRIAKKRLPPSVYSALLAGTEEGISYRDNTAAFAELGFAPRLASTTPARDMTTSVMGQTIALPVLISPTGVQAVHPEGELAVARAAASRGTVIGLSSFASQPVEEVVRANPQTFFQLYWLGSKDFMLHVMNRARDAGAAGLIVTLDWSFSHGRDWGSPHIPEKLDLQTMLRFAPELARRPRWLLGWLRSGVRPDLTVPNMSAADGRSPGFFEAYGEWIATAPPSWEDIRWLRKEWDGPFMLKGVLRVDDARRAADIGVTAVSLSNHGGNNLDGTPAPIRALSAIADAVAADVDIVLDGGIRRGGDVVKALALGARAVMIGRAYLWGLAANGQAGVENVLDILRAGIDSTLRGLGRGAASELREEDVLVPAGFTRDLGAHELSSTALQDSQ